MPLNIFIGIVILDPMKNSLLLALTLFPVIAFADEARDHFWYCGHEYAPTRPGSDELRRQYLEKIWVKRLHSPRQPLLLTMRPGDKINELNVPISYSAKRERFEFTSNLLEECQDYDCSGVERVEGFFQRKEGDDPVEMRITFSFFRDLHAPGETAHHWKESFVFTGGKTISACY